MLDINNFNKSRNKTISELIEEAFSGRNNSSNDSIIRTDEPIDDEKLTVPFKKNLKERINST